MTNDTTPAHLVAGLSQIAQVLRSDQWALGEKHALTPTQIGVLTALGRQGPMRVSALAQQMMVTQPTISDAISALEAKALVARRADPDDGRARVVDVTGKGRALLPELTAADAATKAVEALDEPDRAALKRSLSLIIRNLQDSGRISPRRDCLTCRFFQLFRYRDAAKPHHCAFVDAAFGDADLQFDCADHEDAAPEKARDSLVRFRKRGGG